MYRETVQTRFTAAMVFGLAVLTLVAGPSTATGKTIKPDRSFGKGGYVRIDSSGRKLDGAPRCRVDARGRLFVYSQVRSIKGEAAHLRVGVARYTSRGRLDRSFGRKGMLYKSAPGLSSLIQIDSNGTMLASDMKKLSEPSGYVLSIGRIKSSGGRDESFGVGGVIQVSVGDKYANVVPLAHGRLAIRARDRVMLFHTNGQLDESFGVDGTVSFDFNVFHLKELPDGRLLVGGQTDTAAGTNEFVVSRISAAGSPDPTFGMGGTYRESEVRNSEARKLIAPDGSQPALYSHLISDLAALSDGSVQVVVGSGRTGGDVTVEWTTRLDNTGHVVNNYGVRGTAHLGENYFDDGLDLASSESVDSTILPDGRIASIYTSWSEDKFDEKDDFSPQTLSGIVFPKTGSSSSSKVRRFSLRGFKSAYVLRSTSRRYIYVCGKFRGRWTASRFRFR